MKKKKLKEKRKSGLLKCLSRMVQSRAKWVGLSMCIYSKEFKASLVDHKYVNQEGSIGGVKLL